MPRNLAFSSLLGLIYAEFVAYLAILAISLWCGQAVSDDASFSIFSIFGIVGIAFGSLAAYEQAELRRIVG